MSEPTEQQLQAVRDLAQSDPVVGPLLAWSKGEVGCCSGCQGTGYSGDPETNGACPDCRATGCAHPPPLCQDEPDSVEDLLDAMHNVIEGNLPEGFAQRRLRNLLTRLRATREDDR